MRTRVGYAGGKILNPTYYDIGDHSETIQIEYDPTQISYEELLEAFWQGHSPVGPSYLRQYASLILYHTAEQRRLAAAGLAADNNLAERSLRPLVVVRRISGGTRSPQGSQTRMTLASIFATLKARGLNPFTECLNLIRANSCASV